MILLEQFKAITARHPLFTEAIKNINSAISQAVVGNLIFLFGPSGVGKTTLLKLLVQRKLEYRSAERENGYLQIVRIEVPFPNGHEFSWKEFYRRGLQILGEPLVDRKIHSLDALSEQTSPSLIAEYRTPGHELRVAFENALRNRRVKLLLLDEAQHIAKGFGGAKLSGQLDYLKSLANMSGTIIVLAGTYELLSFRNLSAQLSRRSIDVHLPRYRAENNKEMSQFKKIIWVFMNESPLSWDDKILADYSYLYVYSAGCVGILKDWLDRAHVYAVEQESDVLTRDHLIKTRLSDDQLNTIAEELRVGENILTIKKESYENLKAILGVRSSDPLRQVQPAVAPHSAKVTSIKKVTKRKNVGLRNPKRDAIGK